MRGRRIIVGAWLVALTSSVSGRANAPAGQYRVFDAQDTFIVDNKTKLAWRRAAIPLPASPTQAQVRAACADPKLADGPWRPPTVRELLTLVDEVPHPVYVGGKTESVHIDRNAFPVTPIDARYVTLGPEGSSFSVDFGQGTASATTPGTSAYVRCVK